MQKTKAVNSQEKILEAKQKTTGRLENEQIRKNKRQGTFIW